MSRKIFLLSQVLSSLQLCLSSVNIVESNFANSDVFRKNECRADTRQYQWKINYNYVRVHVNTYHLVVIQTEAVTCNVFNKFNVGYF